MASWFVSWKVLGGGEGSEGHCRKHRVQNQAARGLNARDPLALSVTPEGTLYLCVFPCLYQGDPNERSLQHRV